MFDRVTYSNGILEFHTADFASQAGAATALRQSSMAFTDKTVTLGSYGPFPLPTEFRAGSDFQRMIASCGGNARVTGLSKTPRKRPGWPMLTYAYRLYLDHKGVAVSRVLPDALRHIVETKAALWNAMVARCEQTIEAGQPVPAEAIDALAVEVKAALTVFNDALGRSKDKIAFPQDEPTEVPAKRFDAYARFKFRLEHIGKEGKPVPEGMLDRLRTFVEQYPYNWEPLHVFERSIESVGKEIAAAKSIPDKIARPVIEAFRACFKRRRTQKVKGFVGLPRTKDVRRFNWFHEEPFRSGGLEVPRFVAKGIVPLRFGPPAPAATTGHPEIKGLRAQLRTLQPVTFRIEGHEVTFAALMHRPLPKNGMLKRWRLVHRDGEYWLNFMVEVPPFVKNARAVVERDVAGLDVNWRVLPSGEILIAMLADGKDDTMITLSMDRSSAATDQGGMIVAGAEGGFRTVSLGVGPSRWGRHNVAIGVNYGIPDTFAGLRTIRHLRDTAKDELKIRIAKAMGDETPIYLTACGARGLKKMADEIEARFPETAKDIRDWSVQDRDYCRVLRKASDLLDGRLRRGYDQLAHQLCRVLAPRGIRVISIEEHFLKKIAEAEKKEQPVALQKSARYRQAVGVGRFIDILGQIGIKYGIALKRNNAMYTTALCRFCAAKCEFDGRRTMQCPGCSRVIDQDQNAAHNLRMAEITQMTQEQTVSEAAPVSGSTMIVTIGRVTIDGVLKQKRDVAISFSEENQREEVAVQ